MCMCVDNEQLLFASYCFAIHGFFSDKTSLQDKHSCWQSRVYLHWGILRRSMGAWNPSNYPLTFIDAPDQEIQKYCTALFRKHYGSMDWSILQINYHNMRVKFLAGNEGYWDEYHLGNLAISVENVRKSGSRSNYVNWRCWKSNSNHLSQKYHEEDQESVVA